MPPIRPELLDELLKDYKKPDDLLGQDGLLRVWMWGRISINSSHKCPLVVLSILILARRLYSTLSSVSASVRISDAYLG